jgi:hypothetical protein
VVSLAAYARPRQHDSHVFLSMRIVLLPAMTQMAKWNGLYPVVDHVCFLIALRSR